MGRLELAAAPQTQGTTAVPVWQAVSAARAVSGTALLSVRMAAPEVMLVAVAVAVFWKQWLVALVALRPLVVSEVSVYSNPAQTAMLRFAVVTGLSDEQRLGMQD